MHKLATAVLIATVMVAMAAARSDPSQASCAAVPGVPSSGVAGAPLVFVGTVTGTADQERTATVHVDEVWTGQRLQPEVTLHGSPDLSAAATSVDRHYQTGHQYLFAPASPSGPPYDDNSCTMTREFTAEAASLRPANIIRYPAAPPGSPVLLVAAVAVATAAGLLFVASRVRARWTAQTHP